MLLIASQYTFDFANPKRRGLAWREYEQARAKKIMENVNDKPDTTVPVQESTDDRSDVGDEERNDLQEINVADDERDGKASDETDIQPRQEMEKVEEQVSNTEVEPDTIEKKDTESSAESKTDLDNWNDWVEAANAEAAKEAQQEGMLFGDDNLKKTEIKERASLVQKYDQDNAWSEAKRIWKSKHPDQNIKDWKHAFISGRIHELPWQQYLDYKDKEVQDALESRIKPDLTEVIEPDGYKQNAEQSDKSVWSKIRDNEK